MVASITNLFPVQRAIKQLTHLPQCHIYASVNWVSVGSDNGLAPGRREAIVKTSAGILLIGPLETNLCEILIEIQTFSLKKIHLKISSGKWWPFCLSLNVLNN